MNVCIAVPWDQEFGGVATVVGNLAKYLESQGHSALFAFPERGNGLVQKRTKQGFRGFALNMRGPYDTTHPLKSATAFAAHFPGTLRQITSSLRQEGVTIVNVHYPIDGFVYFGLLRHLGMARLVVSIHGADLFPKGQRSHRYSKATRFLLSAADRIVAPSNGFLRQFTEVFPQHIGKSRCIHNGIDLQALGPSENEHKFVDGKYILCIADHNVKKGLDVLLRAFACLGNSGAQVGAAGGPALKLLLAGDGALRKDLEELARELGLQGRAVFLGRRGRSEIVGLLHGCELLVLPSRSEPFGIALIEAMACRKPVVASSVGGILEIVTPGVDGILVAPEKPEALATAIATVLGDPELHERMGRSARETVVRRFTHLQTGRSYLELYEELARKA